MKKINLDSENTTWVLPGKGKWLESVRSKPLRQRKSCLCCLFVFLSFGTVFAQKPETIAKKLANPLGYISVPLQNNFDFNIPHNNGFRWTLNLMPVFPFSLGKKLNVINRVVLPVITQSDIYGKTHQNGFGDLLINTFFSPKNGKSIWGIGPSLYFPTGFPELLTAKKWAAGPGFIFVQQSPKVMVGIMLFHIWSFAGDDKRADINYTYFQPLVVYSFKHGWGTGLTLETGQDWEKNVTNSAIIFTGQKLIRFGGQLINLVLGPKLFSGNFNAPEFGFRASVNFLFP